MKKAIALILTLACVSLALTSCGTSGPKTAAESFFKAFAKLDFDAAREVCTEEGKASLSLLEAVASGMTEEDKAEFTNKYNVKITKVDVKGDTAVAHYTVPDAEGEQTIDLVKENGKWKVEFKKQL